MSNTNQKAETVDPVLSTKDGRWPIFIKLFILLIAASVLAELIGTVTIPLGPIGKISIIPMIFSMIIAVLFTPDALGRGDRALKKAVQREGSPAGRERDHAHTAELA